MSAASLLSLFGLDPRLRGDDRVKKGFIMVDKIVSPALVANAYSAGQKAATVPGLDTAGAGPSFGELLKAGIQNTVSSIRGGEAASASAVTGKADLNDVVQAVTRAEMSLQTVVAIRDRLLTAYQDLLRMPI